MEYRRPCLPDTGKSLYRSQQEKRYGNEHDSSDGDKNYKATMSDGLAESVNRAFSVLVFEMHAQSGFIKEAANAGSIGSTRRRHAPDDVAHIVRHQQCSCTVSGDADRPPQGLAVVRKKTGEHVRSRS